MAYLCAIRGTRPPSPREVNSRGSSPAVGRFAPSGLPSLFPRLIEMIRNLVQFSENSSCLCLCSCSCSCSCLGFCFNGKWCNNVGGRAFPKRQLVAKTAVAAHQRRRGAIARSASGCERGAAKQSRISSFSALGKHFFFDTCHPTENGL